MSELPLSTLCIMQRMKTIVGIDPGKKGAICAILPEGGIAFWDTYEISILNAMGPSIVGIERQVALPRQKGSGTTMMNYGVLLGHLMAYNIKYTEIRPHDWYKHFGIKSGMDTNQRKTATSELMLDIYPEIKDRIYGPRGGLLDGRTDALAIAHYTSVTLFESGG